MTTRTITNLTQVLFKLALAAVLIPIFGSFWPFRYLSNEQLTRLKEMKGLRKGTGFTTVVLDLTVRTVVHSLSFNAVGRFVYCFCYRFLF